MRHSAKLCLCFFLILTLQFVLKTSYCKKKQKKKKIFFKETFSKSGVKHNSDFTQCAHAQSKILHTKYAGKSD